MSERSLVDYVLRGMKGRWSVTKHADAWTPGIPDLSYRCNNYNGWCELKNISRLPVRDGTRVRFDSDFTPAQAGFLIERHGKLLIRVQPLRLYLGMYCDEAMEMHHEGGWPLGQMRLFSWEWNRQINWEEFATWISDPATTIRP